MFCAGRVITASKKPPVLSRFPRVSACVPLSFYLVCLCACAQGACHEVPGVTPWTATRRGKDSKDCQSSPGANHLPPAFCRALASLCRCASFSTAEAALRAALPIAPRKPGGPKAAASATVGRHQSARHGAASSASGRRGLSSRALRRRGSGAAARADTALARARFAYAAKPPAVVTVEAAADCGGGGGGGGGGGACAGCAHAGWAVG